MTQITRRDLGVLAVSALATSVTLSKPMLAAGPARVVIIGGGAGGAAVATRLKAADPALDVTVIEPKAEYTTCYYSNLFLGGFRTFQAITFNYEGMK